MKVKIKVEKEFDIVTLVIHAGVRYWEDATINGVEDNEGTLTPCRDGALWKPIIDIESGIVSNWNKGTEAEIHFNVCDAGSYYLQDKDGANILSIENNYVPNIACPAGGGYGDYIIMNIDKDGKIKGWNPDIDDFLTEEDE